MTRCMGCMNEYEDGLTVCPHCGYKQGTPAREAYQLPPETILNGRYLVGRVLGFGGFGITYIAWDLQLEKKVAIKEYMPSDFATRSPGETRVSIYSGKAGGLFAAGMKGFLDESKRLAVFNHEEGIVHIFDSFLENGTAYIVMEYLEGKTLKELLKERGGKIPYREAISYLTPVLKSLDIVHQAGIIHRDIAPDNIFITYDGKVKLIDFGASRYFTLSQSRSLSVILKQGYAPPEQYNSHGKQGPWSDIYAVCATLYRAITGTVPEDSLERSANDTLVPPSQMGIQLPQNIENALMNGLNLKPENRIQSAWALAQVLGGDTQVQRVREKKKKDDVGKWSKKQITIAIISVVLILAIIIGTVLGVVLTKPALDPDVYATVPDYIGETFTDAREKWAKYCDRKEITNIDLAVLQGVPIDQIQDYQIDQIYEMQPKAGSWFKKAPENKEYLYVTVVLPSVQEIIDENTGKDSWTMQDLENYSKNDAQRIVDSMEGVRVEFKEVPSEKSEGTVVGSETKPGDPVKPNDNITIDISDGSLVNVVDPVDPDAQPPLTADQVKWVVEPTWDFMDVEPIDGESFSDFRGEDLFADGKTPIFTLWGVEMSFPLYSNLPEYYNIQRADGTWTVFYMPERAVFSNGNEKARRISAEGLMMSRQSFNLQSPWNVIYGGGRGYTLLVPYWDTNNQQAYIMAEGVGDLELKRLSDCGLQKSYPLKQSDLPSDLTNQLEFLLDYTFYDEMMSDVHQMADQSLYAYVNPEGKLITDFIYEDANDFSDGLAACRRNGLWGYIDETGKELMGFIYTNASPCTDDTMVVQKNGKSGLLYRDGSVLIGFGEFEDLAPSYNNELWAKQDGKWGLIDLNDVKQQMGIGEENIETGHSTNDINAFVEKSSELIKKQGKIPAMQNGEMSSPDDEWFNPNGILSTTILDFDSDGSDEMLVCAAEKLEQSDTSESNIVLYMYDIQNGEIIQSDKMLLGAYIQSDYMDTNQVEVTLRPNYWKEEIISVHTLLNNEKSYIVCENRAYSSAFANGDTQSYWILEYINGVFRYVCSFTQTDGGSMGFEYTGYVFENGICIKSDLYYSAAPNEYSPYSSFGQAITTFFDQYGLKLNDDIKNQNSVFSDEFHSVLSPENDMVLNFELVNTMISSDFLNGIYRFSAALTSGDN